MRNGEVESCESQRTIAQYSISGKQQLIDMLKKINRYID